jgi:feruloyl esterase
MAAEQAEQACINLAGLTMVNTSIEVAEVVGAGKFAPPTTRDNRVSSSVNSETEARNRIYQSLPAFCRVAIRLTPSLDSDIKMEIWLPVETWNGKYLAVGNSAFRGRVRHTAMIEPLTRGYATSSTDTGHTGNTASFGLGHPEKVIDFGWRAVHEMASTSKQIVAAYYETGPQYSYWTGCSAGGRQAMKEAQRFPNDFNGIVAGAPGLDWTGRATAALRAAQVLEIDESARLDSSKRELLYNAAINSCDSNDGLVDGLISKPEECGFDPAVLQCAAGEETAACLTPAQVNTARMLYSSPINPASGREITGLLPGSEQGWTDLGWTASARATGMEQFKYLVYSDPNWTLQQFDFSQGIVDAEETDSDTLNALNPDLKPFIDSGGKLIQYHGWSDPQISPSNTTQYYQQVTDELGGRGEIHDSYRLFMVPGMAHCSGGPGPNRFDMLSALEAWVEQGVAPDSVIATHQVDGEVDRSRPLCPFPEIATYSGTGSIDEAANFSCSSP